MTRRSARPVVALALALACALAMAACSESDSDEDAVKETLTGFFTDVAENRGTEACDALTTGNVHFLSVVAPAAGVPATCADAVKAAHGQLSEEEKEAFKTAEIKKVTISGDTATVAPEDVEFELVGRSTLLSSVKSGQVVLRRAGDEWKIESLG